MKTKIVGILVCMLLMTAIALPVAGNSERILNNNYNFVIGQKTVSSEKIKISNFFSGEIDIAVTNAEDNLVSVFKGDGVGGFSYYGNASVGLWPLGLTIGDYNKDGYFDLISSNFNNNTITVLLGDGTGSFMSSGDYDVGPYPLNMVTDDFNEDSNPDIAVANMWNDSISVLFGDGTGGFGTQQTYAVGSGSGPVTLSSGDFNNDYHCDLIVASGDDNNITVLLGDGTGGFTLFGTYYLGAGYFPLPIQKADFNNDQNLDVVVGSGALPCVGVLLGDGNGGFGPIQNFTTGAGYERFSIVTDDFNKDGNADIAIPNTNENTISVLLGDGTGGFGTHQTYSVGDYPVCITSADFNSDGNSDLAITNAIIGTVSIYLGDGAGGFGPEYTFNTGYLSIAIVAADFDNEPPSIPTITGKSNGNVGTEYEYTFNAVDPDGDNVK